MKTKDENVFAKYTDEKTFGKIAKFHTVSEMWKRSVTEYADDIAVSDRGETYTYARLEEDAAGFRGTLSGAGLKKGDRVALLAVNSYEFVKAYIAAVTYGCTVAVLPAQLDEMSVFGCCMKFGVKALVYG
jgi:acyl-CoA synthetase (AMP-forming)/AMP-acid ligase II